MIRVSCAKRVATLVALVLLGLAAYGTGCGAAVLAGEGSSDGDIGSRPTQAAGFPIRVGQVGPIAAGNPLQQPFACVTQDTLLGPPVVDNHDGGGLPITDGSGKVIGYSADCGAPMKVLYFYRASDDSASAPLRAYDERNPPRNVATVDVNGRRVPFIVRYEIGTLNRFIYTIASLSPQVDVTDPAHPDESVWNHKLIFFLYGGVGLGHTQSATPYPLKYFSNPTLQIGFAEFLAHGYDIVESTGTSTATTYNLVLEGQTARMVKDQFVAEFGKPKYTFGLGGSGGSIQQFIYAQNDPSLLDGLVPTHVYPDMITQVNPVGDCELLEYYFDVADAKVNGTGRVNPKWKSWKNRELIEGFHGINGFKTKKVFASSAQPGSEACIEAWFGAVPMYFNPLYGATSDPAYKAIPSAVIRLTPLSYFDDLETIFGMIPGTRLAQSTYDNVGVQYGLQALKDGKITKKEFLDVNAHVGGWKPRQDDVPPGFPFQGGKETGNIDPWSARNATAGSHLTSDDVAPRTSGSVSAMQAAYKAGLVFGGKINLPIIIIEPYLEPELNMHATREPFAVRQRLIDARGNADNLAIWMIGNSGDMVPSGLALRAFADEERWLESGRRPSNVVDACFGADGSLIASGPDVFRGEVSPNGAQVLSDVSAGGPCTKAYPIFSMPRVVSGLNVSDHVFKCALEPVGEAIKDGIYGRVLFTEEERARLLKIFPTGVCDYSKPDQGLPAG